MSYGSCVSSCEIFERLEMFEECVECLLVADRIGKAKELAKKCLKERETPKMLFLYGNLMKDKSYYIKAWELSNQSFFIAMNALARHSLAEKNADKCVECFEKSLKVNHY